MSGRYCEGKIKMASEKVSRKMVPEIKYVNANNAVIHTENSKLLLELGFWQKLAWELGFGTPFTTLFQQINVVFDWSPFLANVKHRGARYLSKQASCFRYASFSRFFT